jgi:hypothetical protein
LDQRPHARHRSQRPQPLERSRRHPHQLKITSSSGTRFPQPDSPSPTRRPAPAGRRVSFSKAGNPHHPKDPATFNIGEKPCKSCWVGYAL